ncbi:TetR/AcrR family transcriptional regulator [Bacillus carboniphilus]|uniref:TetR/AcrR family transcriptional regulator n=1 Tax=Bacillus carboniphilus TaxID=86663 RepID=A0ABY9JTL5_9BACI|nr:TetR/AcrR family transcriptional regulator [Bacillus carboniphilus]WLR41775.1 TetR/AcrR family transcriptional regulator [Bacillus carboniphilus]
MNEQKKEQYIQKLIPITRERGLQSITSDQIAQIMDLSKATVYKYFSSKDNIILKIIDQYLAYINKVSEKEELELQNMAISFQESLNETINIVLYVSEKLVSDVRSLYPEKYEQLEEALQKREKNLLVFYRDGQKKGFFYDGNVELWLEQDYQMIKLIVDPQFLMEKDLTLKTALWEYYQMKKRQVVKSVYMEQIEDDYMKEKIDKIAKKLAKNLL